MGPCPCGCVVACWSRVKVLICVAAMASLARALSVLEECASRRRLRQECERSSAVRMEWAAATLLTCCGVHAHVGVCLACGPQLTFYPLGKEIRNVRCMRCGVWGHRSGDRECKVETNPNDAARLEREDPMTSMKVPSRLVAHTAAHTRLDSLLVSVPGFGRRTARPTRPTRSTRSTRSTWSVGVWCASERR